MTTTAIRQRLYEYIRIADKKKVKAIYTMVEDEFNESSDWTKDEQFMAELEKRSAEYKSGKVKGVPWEVAKKEILASSKQKSKK